MCMVKGQVVRRRHTEQEAADAVGLRTSSCLILGEEVGKTV